MSRAREGLRPQDAPSMGRSRAEQRTTRGDWRDARDARVRSGLGATGAVGTADRARPGRMGPGFASRWGRGRGEPFASVLLQKTGARAHHVFCAALAAEEFRDTRPG